MRNKDCIAPSYRGDTAPYLNNNEQREKKPELRHTIRNESLLNGVRSVNVTTDNRFLIITYEKSIPRIRILDLEKLEFLPGNYEGHTESVRTTKITADNKAFYTASWDGSSRRFEIDSGKCTQIVSGFGRSPSCFLDPDQKFLFTASYDSDFDLESKNNVRCWDLSSGRTIRLYKHTRDRISPESIDIAYENGLVYTGSDDGCAFQWKLRSGEPLIRYFAFSGSVRKLALSANYLAAACTDGIVRVHYKLTGVLFRNFYHADHDVREVRISKDETRLWSATEGGSVSCFSLITGELIFCRKIHPLWIWSICLMNDEKILVTGSGDGTVAFLSADSGQIVAQLYNLPDRNDFLITCPQDKAFPSGLFYTTNTGLIQVVSEDKDNQIKEILDSADPGREAYINKLNLKNLIITRLKNNRHYTSLTENYMQNKKVLEQIKKQELPHMLRS